jgi:hypothetical protein
VRLRLCLDQWFRMRVKQYLKESRAMRIETVINCPCDLGCNARLPNLGELHPCPDGARFATFYIKLHNRLLRP